MSAERHVPTLPAFDGRHVFGRLASLVRLVCGMFALILALHVAFAVGQANLDNWLVAQVVDWSDGLTLGLPGLFQHPNADFLTIADHGVPAFTWLIIGAVVGRVLRRLEASVPGGWAMISRSR
ncbi:MAG: hypothetical protein ACR2G2_07335 [Pseudonocardia sp.]